MPDLIKDHMPWVIAILVAGASMVVSVNHKLVDNGESRILLLETKVQQLERYCCQELQGVGE